MSLGPLQDYSKTSQVSLLPLNGGQVQAISILFKERKLKKRTPLNRQSHDRIITHETDSQEGERVACYIGFNGTMSTLLELIVLSVSKLTQEIK